jgi:hypothetical protein
VHRALGDRPNSSANFISSSARIPPLGRARRPNLSRLYDARAAWLAAVAATAGKGGRVLLAFVVWSALLLLLLLKFLEKFPLIPHQVQLKAGHAEHAQLGQSGRARHLLLA